MNMTDEILNSWTDADECLADKIENVESRVNTLSPKGNIKMEYAEVGSGKSITYNNIMFALVNFGRVTSGNINLNAIYAAAGASIINIKEPSYMSLTSAKEGQFTISNTGSQTIQGLVIYVTM